MDDFGLVGALQDLEFRAGVGNIVLFLSALIMNL